MEGKSWRVWGPRPGACPSAVLRAPETPGERLRARVGSPGLTPTSHQASNTPAAPHPPPAELQIASPQPELQMFLPDQGPN